MKPLLLVAVLSLLASPLAARQVPARLTLDDAIRIAESRSPASRRAMNTLERSEINQRMSFNDTFMPRLASGLTFSASRYRQYQADNFDGTPLANPYYAEGSSSRTNQSFLLAMTLFSGQSLANHRVTRANARSVEASVDAALHGIRVDVSRTFYRAIQAEEAVELEARLLARARDDREATDRMFRIGMVGPESVSGARLTLARREHALERARSEARKARIELLEVMGVEDDSPFELAGELPEPFDPALVDADALVAFAIGSSPRVRQADAAVDAAAAGARASRATRWPTITADAGFRRTRATDGYDAFLDVNPQNWGYDARVMVSVPIPYVNLNERPRIALAELQRADAEEDLRQARLTMEKDVRFMVADLGTAYTEIALLEQQAELMRERVELQEARLQAGARIDFLRLEDFREEAAQAERAVHNARIAFQMQLLALEQLIGMEVRR